MKKYISTQIENNDSNQLNVPAGPWAEPWLVHIYESNEAARTVYIRHDSAGRVSLHSLVAHWPELLWAADICAVRFLPEGLGILKKNKYFTEYVNGFHGVRAGLFAGAELDAAAVDEAFTRFGTFVKAGRFAKMLGLSDVAAEDFSKSYERAFLPVSEEEAATWTFKVLHGRAAVSIFKRRNLPAAENESTLYQACMNNKRHAVDWYTYQRGRVAVAAIYGQDGKVYARAVLWLVAEVVDKDSGAVVYVGKLADRQYFYSDRCRMVLRHFLRGIGAGWKNDTTHDMDGAFTLPDGVQVDGGTHRIRAAVVAQPEGCKGYPFLDTLAAVSSDGWASSSEVGLTGTVYKLRSTQGQREYVGRYVRVTLGEFAGQVFKADRCHGLILPDGTREFMRGQFEGLNNYGPLSRMYEGGFDSEGGEYVPAGLTSVHSVELRGLYSSGETRAISARVYPHQLEFDRTAGRWAVARLWDTEAGAWLPVDRFRWSSSGAVAAV